MLLILAGNAAAAEPYAAAATKLRTDFLLGLEKSSVETAPPTAAGVLSLQFAQREAALEILEFGLKTCLSAIVAADLRTAPCCARASSMLRLKWHSPRAADACQDQSALLARLGSAGLQVDFSALNREKSSGLAAMIQNGKMRVLGTIVNSGTARVGRAWLERLLRTASEIGFSHGPLWASLCAGEGQETLRGLSPVIPIEYHSRLRFRIPLVEEDISLAEVMVREALGMDISRVCAVPPA
jgi:hypothetical protein